MEIDKKIENIPNSENQKIPVPWQLKLIAVFVFLGSLLGITYFWYSTLILSVIVVPLGIIVGCLFSYNLWKGKKWVREVAVFFGGMGTAGHVIDLTENILGSQLSLVATVIDLVVLIISLFVVGYLWKTRKEVYGIQVTTITHSESNTIATDNSILATKKHKKGFLTYAPLLLLILNIPFLIIDFLGITSSESMELGGIIIILHILAVVSAVPFIIWNLVSDSKVAKTISLIHAGLFLGPFILFEIFVFIIAPVSNYTYTKEGNDIADYVLENPTFKVVAMSGNWIKPISNEYPIVFLDEHEEKNIYVADERIYEYYRKEYFIKHGRELNVKLTPDRYGNGSAQDFILNSKHPLDILLSEKLQIPFGERYKYVSVVLFDEENNEVNDEWLKKQISNDTRQTNKITGILEEDKTSTDKKIRYMDTTGGLVKNLLWDSEVAKCLMNNADAPCGNIQGKIVTVETLPIGDVELITKLHMPKEDIKPSVAKPTSTINITTNTNTQKTIPIIEPSKPVQNNPTNPIQLTRNNYQNVFEQALKDLHSRVQKSNSMPYIYKNVCGSEIYTINNEVAKLGYEGVKFFCNVSSEGNTWSVALFVSGDTEYGLCTNNSGEQIWLGMEVWNILKSCNSNP